MPLIQPDRLLGKFMVYFNQPHQWTDQELRLAQVIAQNLSAIIGRLQALEEMQRATEELRHTVKALKRGKKRSPSWPNLTSRSSLRPPLAL